MKALTHRGLAVAGLLGLAALCLCAPAASAADQADGTAITVEGTLDVLIADDFERNRSETLYALTEARSGQVFKLAFEGPPPADLRTGMRVRARGRTLDGQLVVAEGSGEAALRAEGAFQVLEAPPLAAQALVAVDNHTVLAIIVNLTDASVTASSSSINSRLFSTTSDSVKGFYEECSYGAITFSGKVVGPYKINMSKSDGVDAWGWANAASDKARADGNNPDGYDHVVYVVPMGIASWSGLAIVGGKTVWVAGQSTQVYAHELGHNLGLLHASTDSDDNGTVDAEYGDSSCVMGAGPLVHPNLPHKRQKGWIPSSKVKSVTASGTFEIAPAHNNPSSITRLQGLRLDIDGSSQDYYISYRRAVGYDGDLNSTYANKVSVHRWSGSGNTLFVKALDAGDTFNKWSSSGFTVTVQENNSSYARVEVLVSGSSLTRTWDDDGGHFWDSAARWSGDNIPDTAEENVEFNNDTGSDTTQSGTINGTSYTLQRVGLNGISPTIGQLHFYDNVSGTAGWLLNCGDGTSTLTVTGDPVIRNTYGPHLIDGGGGTLKLKLGRSGWNTIQVANAIQINAVISGASSASKLVKTGGGALVLTGANTYVGGTELLDGTLRVDDLEAIGSGYLAIKGNGLFRYDGGSATTTRSLWMNEGDGGGGGTLEIAQSGTTLTWTPGGGAVNQNLAKSGPGGLSFGGPISGGAAVSVNGGTLTLTGNSTFTGNVTVSGGALRLQSNNAVGSTAKTVTAAVALAEIQLQGGISIPSGVTFRTSNNNADDGFVALRNVSGNNTIQGAVSAIGGNGGSIYASDSGTLTFAGTLSAGAADRDIVFMGSGNFLVSGAIKNGSSVAMPVRKEGAGTLTLAGANSYSGPTTLNAGVTRLGAANGIPAGNDVVVAGTLDLNGLAQTLDTLTGAGSILTGGGALTIGSGGGSSTFSGSIGGAGSVTKTGAGTQTLTGAHTYSGATTLDGGTLLVNGAHSGGAYTVKSGATLGGGGRIGAAVTVRANGILAPGGTGGAATLTVADLTLEEGAVLNWNQGPSAADRTVVTGTLKLPATLTVNVSALAGAALSYPVVLCSYAGGSLAGVTNLSGWTVTGEAGFAVARVDESAGRVLLDERLVEERVWVGGGADTAWTTGSNWGGGAAPAAGDALVFGGSLTANTNDFAAGTDFSGLRFAADAAAFTLAGRAVDLFGNIVNASANHQAIDLDLALSMPARVVDTGAAGLTVSGALSGGFGLTKAGSGTLSLAAENTYTGGTAVEDGMLQVGVGGAAGTLAAGIPVTIRADGTLRQFRADAADLGLSNPVSGSGTWSFLGTGASTQSRYTLNGDSSGFAGTVAIDRARVNVDDYRADVGLAAVIRVLDGGQLFFQSAGVFPNNAEIVGIGWTEAAGILGALRLQNGVNIAGVITLTGDARIVAHGSTGALSGLTAESGGAHALDLRNTSATANSTLVLANTSTRTGPTTVAGLVAAVRNAGALGSGAVTVQGNGTAARITRLQLEGVTVGNDIVLDSTALTDYRGALHAAGAARSTVTGAVTVRASIGNGGHLAAEGGTAAVLQLLGPIYSEGPTVVVRLGTVELGGGGSYAQMDLGEGLLRLVANDGVCATAVLQLGISNPGTFDLNGYNQTLGQLTRGTRDATVRNDGASPSTLTVNAATNHAFTGTLVDGAGGLALAKDGGAALTLSGTNTFSGTTTVRGGALVLGSGNALQNSTLDYDDHGGVLRFGVLNGATLGALQGGQGLALANDSAAAVALRVGNNNASTLYGGVLSGAGSLVKIGAGALTLAGASTFAGPTTLTGGTLTLADGDNRLNPASTLIFTTSSALNLDRVRQTFSELVFTNTVTSSHTIGGGGILAVSGAASLDVAPKAQSIGLTVDLSGLSGLTYDAPGDAFRVGGDSRTSPPDYRYSWADVTLPDVNAITASVLGVGDIGYGSGSAANTNWLRLGAGNTFHVGTLVIGSRLASATCVFRAGLASPELVLRGAGGANGVRSVVVGQQNHYAANNITHTLDVSAGRLDAVVDTLTIGVSLDRLGTENGVFTMGAGSLVVTNTMVVGQVQGTAANTRAGVGMFTLTSNGVARVRTILLADKQTTVATATTAGTLQLSGGTLRVGAIQPGAGTGTRVCNWTAGTIGNHDGSTDLTIHGGLTKLELLGAGRHAFDIDAGRQGTVHQALSGAGALTKTGDGTLALNATNTYSGATAVEGGTLLVNGAHSGGGAYTVNAGATLGGSGRIAAALTVRGGGMLAPAGDGAVGAVTVAGDATFEPDAVLRVDCGLATNDVAVVTGTLALPERMTIAFKTLAGVSPTDCVVLFQYGDLAAPFGFEQWTIAGDVHYSVYDEAETRRVVARAKDGFLLIVR